MLDFGALPPEVNSGRMYAGAGSGPMLAAASAWDGLAAELSSTATGYASALAELSSGLWLGPASESMVAAATPYITWLSAAGAAAEQAGTQARAAAAAYETAFALTVPPAVIAANRTLFAALVATNFFGQNTPAIAATEAQYVEIWAQDAVAMYGYAASSAIASELSQFSDPSQTTDDSGLSAQAAAVSQALADPANNLQAATSAISNAITNSTVSQWITQALYQLSAQVSALGANLNNLPIVQGFNQLTTGMRTTLARTYELSYFDFAPVNYFSSIVQQLATGPGGATAGAGGAWYPTPAFAGLGTGGWHPPVGAVASLSSATKIGPLSVPPSWAAAPAGLEQAPAEVAGVNPVATSNAASNGLLRGIPLSGAGRRASTAYTHKYGFRKSVLARPPAGG